MAPNEKSRPGRGAAPRTALVTGCDSSVPQGGLFDDRAEDEVAGTVIATREGYGFAAAWVEAGHFHHPAIRRVFEAAPIVNEVPFVATDPRRVFDSTMFRVGVFSVLADVPLWRLEQWVTNRSGMHGTNGASARRVAAAAQRRARVFALEQELEDLKAAG